MTGLVIIGAGQAAAQLAFSMRAAGDNGPITLVGDEIHPPYSRPPLSKGFLKDDTQEEDLFFRPTEWFADNGVTLRLGQRAQRIDRARCSVILPDAEISYRTLVLATGAQPRVLPELYPSLTNVVTLRGIDDIHRIKGLLPDCERIAVIGAGFIGLEFAAAMRMAARDVTVVEAGGRVLGRAVSPVLSDWFADLHRSRGVKMCLDTRLASVQTKHNRVTSLDLFDGKQLAADLVLVGVGASPNDILAREAGLNCSDGVLVDANLCSSDRNIFCIGDCCRFPLPDGQMVRLESVQNAVDHAKHLARCLNGDPSPYRMTPWFWSDQFDVKLQIAGLLPKVLNAQLAPANAQRFSLDHIHDGRLLCRESVNDFRNHMAGRKAIGELIVD